MSKQYLFKRKQGWYFRIAIPERVRHLYGGSNRIVKTLKTRDLKVAQERKIPMLLHYKEKFRKAVQNLEQAEGPDTCRFLGEWTYILGLVAGGLSSLLQGFPMEPSLHGYLEISLQEGLACLLRAPHEFINCRIDHL